MREITSCEVCGNTNLASVMDLGKHPLPDALVPIGTKELPLTYPIEVLYCDKCCTAHQRFQVDKHLLFPPSYHYRARMTQDVLDGMEQLAGSVAFETDLKDKKVLDVGCNDGSLLTFFKQLGAKTYGIEPTAAAVDARDAGHEVYRVFLDRSTAEMFVDLHGQPDIITVTNVFAHIEHQEGLRAAVRLLASPTTKVVIENHYLGSVIERHQFDTFYHEHPRTYSFNSFIHIARRLRMHVETVEFPQRYGGNIRVILEDGMRYQRCPDLEYKFGNKLVGLMDQVDEWSLNKAQELRAIYQKAGPIACAAFPGRAAILMRLLGLPDETFKAVYEKPGSKKIGYYVPGTHIPILSDQDYPMGTANAATPLVNLAWHIPAEIEHRWRDELHFPGRIIQVVDPSDFR